MHPGIWDNICRHSGCHLGAAGQPVWPGLHPHVAHAKAQPICVQGLGLVTSLPYCGFVIPMSKTNRRNYRIHSNNKATQAYQNKNR